MKLFSWMHRKVQKDATGSLQASVVGSTGTYLLLNPSANNQGDYITPCNDTKKTWEPNQHYQHHIKEFNGENTEDYNEKQSTEIFPGFLTIGTLSMEPISEPPTPTLDLPYQAINESVMAEVKFDLKMINEELGKFFKVEAEKEGNIDSSRKNSQASTITLGEEVKEDVSDHNSVIKQVYPLQGYLLRSSTELLETKPNAKKEKVSLCELFRKSTSMESSSTKEAESTKEQTTKKPKSSNLMNKILHPTQTLPNISNHPTHHEAESFPTLRKLNKINQLFHKKVHPEITKDAYAAKEPKYSKYEKVEQKKKKKKKKNQKKNSKSSNDYTGTVLNSEKNGISCWGTCKKGKNHCSNADIEQANDAITQNNMDLLLKEEGGEGKEHWIKTDEEYFVLELQQNEGVQI